MLEFLRTLLFESLPLLLVAIVIALGIAVAVHRRRLTPGSRRGVWITLAAGILLVVIQHLVVTDREAIEILVHELAQAVDEGDMAAIGERIDEAFRTGEVDKQQLMAVIHSRLQQWQIDEPHINALTIEVQGDQADARFRVICDLRSETRVQDTLHSYWHIRCVRREEGWRMLRIEDAEMGPGVFTPQGGIDLMGYLNLRR